jgi:hypothetical protein
MKGKAAEMVKARRIDMDWVPPPGVGLPVGKVLMAKCTTFSIVNEKS